MKKKVILLLIILIPSLIYFLFELTEVNFKKMAYYGPKTVDAKGDTVYYSLPDAAFEFGSISTIQKQDSLGQNMVSLVFNPNTKIKESKEAFIIVFVKDGEEAKLNGILEYEKYKKEKLENLSIVLIKESSLFSDKPTSVDALLKSSSNVSLNTSNLDSNSFQKLNQYYFQQKPAHVFPYFAALVDKERHIRGYYDPTYIAEVKRMIEEYKHLILKDEHANMQNNNAIEKK